MALVRASLTLSDDPKAQLHPPHYLGAYPLAFVWYCCSSDRVWKVLQSFPSCAVELVKRRGESARDQDITRKNASFFLLHSVAYPAVLEMVDANGGCHALHDDESVYNMVTMPPNVLHRNVAFTLQQYFRAHVALAVYQIMRSQPKLSKYPSSPKQQHRSKARKRSTNPPQLARSPSVSLLKSRTRTRSRSFSQDDNSVAHLVPFPHRPVAVDDKSYASPMECT